MLQSASKKRSDIEGRNDHTTHSDFCAIFRDQLDSLFLLALLLTGDELSAEKCFLLAFDTCVQGSPVFKELAISWSRRSVIKAAIRLMLAVRSDASVPLFTDNDNNPKLDQEASLKCVLDLPLFDRFVFVMSVLELYSDSECALLLGCSSTEIPTARLRAFQQISTWANKNYQRHLSGEAQPYVVNPDWLECG